MWTLQAGSTVLLSRPTPNTHPVVADGEVDMMLGSETEDADDVVLTATQESSHEETAATALHSGQIKIQSLSDIVISTL